MDRDDFDRRRLDALRAEAEANGYAEALFATTWRGRAAWVASGTLLAAKTLLRASCAVLVAFIEFLISRVGLAALAAALLALVAVGLWRFERLADPQSPAPGQTAERAYK